MGKLLIETMSVAFNILQESKDDKGMKVKGVFTVADEINGNGRVYRETILDREIDKLKGNISENRVYAEGDHPEDGKSRISNTVALLTGLTKRVEDGRKMYDGEALILNTSKGKDLQEIIRAGGKVGVSSRGYGSLVKGNWLGKVADIVQEDYCMKTFDFVIGQSVKDAEVQMTEQRQDVINILDADFQPHQNSKGGSDTMEIKTLEELRKAFPELCAQLEKDVKAATEKEVTERLHKEFETKIMAEVEKAKETVKEDVIQEIENNVDLTLPMSTLAEIAKLVIPLTPQDVLAECIEGLEAGDEGKGNEELSQKVESLTAEVKLLKDEKKALEEKATKEKEEAANKEAVAKKITELTAGKKHEKILVERLQGCKTVDEVTATFEKENKLIESLTVSDGKKDEGGKGKVLTEGKTTEGKTEGLDAEKQRQRKLAGLK